uniref:NADH-ubiquinone oxidoreductase chain 2 n=1 Tax=Larsonella pumila TaxID=2152751 RepID=A0A5K7TNL1_9GOBI|nr:NADH dehydrogenase subunit 2 [Larsonella pumila]
MNPFMLSLLLFALGLGTTITFASSHWLLAWMGLEINTLAILPLMTQSHHPRPVEAATKYFLAQSAAAATLLFASVTNAWLTGQWNIHLMTHPIPLTMIVLALSLKIGLAPLHIWLPEVLQGLDLMTGLILSTWQKLAPFALLLQLPVQDQTILVGLAITSTLVGGWGGLNQTQLRKILAYSSVAHLGWMMIIIQFTPGLTLMALMIYVIMTCATFLSIKTNFTTTINELTISWSKTPILMTIFPMILLSLGGLPPLTGFLPKWLILQELTKQDLSFIATLVALTALLSLYFYLRLSYSMTLTVSPNNLTSITHWRFLIFGESTPLAASALLSTLLLPAGPTLMATITS